MIEEFAEKAGEKAAENKIKNVAKQAAQKGANNILSSKKEAKSSAEALDNAAKTAGKSAIAAGKAVAKASVGDVPGAVVEVAKDEGFQKLIKGIFIIMILPIIFLAMMPNLIFTPSESQFGEQKEQNNMSIIEFIFGLKNPDVNLNGIKNDLETSTIHLNADENFDIENLLDNKMIDDNSLKVAAHTEKEVTDFDKSTRDADKTMDNMIKATKTLVEKRHKSLKDTIDKDFDARKGECKGTVTKHVTDPFSSGQSSSDKEVVKLMCLFSVQNDGELTNIDFDTYRRWLGDEKNPKNLFDALFWGLFEDDAVEEGFDYWKVKPIKWKGEMLEQKFYDQYKEEKKKDDFDAEKYKDFYKSAIAELLKADPLIKIEERSVTHHSTDPETGETTTWEEYFTDITYTIKSVSVDQICKDVVKFDDAVPKDEEGKPLNRFSSAANRADFYDEMCGDGAGKGVILDYFGISSSSGLSGIYGSGASLVAIALQEYQSNYREYGNNGNKYGEFFGANYQPWCNWFVSWCARQANISEDVIPTTGGTSTTYEFYSNRGLAHPTSEGYKPKPGDIVLHTPGDSGHIEIVVEYIEADNKVKTVGGNTSNTLLEGGAVPADADSVGMHLKDYSYWTYYCEVPYPVTGVAGVGDYVNIPHDSRNLGSAETYMGWHMTTDRTAPEGILKYDAIGAGRAKAQSMYGLTNCATIDNRLCIATTVNIGNQFPVEKGDYIDVVFSDGTVWNCIIAETKDQTWAHGTPANEWGHNDGKVVVEIIYWDYSQNPQNQSKQVEKLIKVGSYSTGVNNNAYKN